MVAVLLGKVRVGRVFAGGHFPTLAARAGVGQEEGANRTIHESEGHRRAVFDFELTRVPAELRGDTFDFADEETPVCHFVDHIDEHWPPAEAGSPWRTGEVGRWLVEQR